ncbi:DUF4905 domain-containing protein [Mucilaginibacter limnophilus]|uniref:DUF4905 domain-containing protein n=2 Tax=Mucilaginibacter limnophilus TaxID=1932778 RepID=A0A3S2Y679_9SPHI|nr:DUF4905 domain-containing protein [Mucilaginibacter limnophilus]
MLSVYPDITKKFEGEIWRLEIDDKTNNLLLEIRNEADKQVSFASLNIETGKVNFEDFTLDERWLAGLESAYKGVLLLHNYESANAPVHKAVIAIDEQTGETLWSNYTMAFDHLSVNGPVVYSTQFLPKKLYVADIQTGFMIRPYNAVIDTEFTNTITVPDMVDASAIASLNIPIEPYGGFVHYVEYNGYRIVSLHTRGERSLEQYLFIIDKNGGVNKVLLNTDIQKLQPEAFVLHKNRLICLKNKTEVLIFKL